MNKKLKMGVKRSIRGCSSALGPARPIKKLQHEATSSPGWACCFWTKPPARYFGYKRALEAKGKRFSTLGIQISLKISEEKKKEGENQGRGTSVKLSWRFCDQFHERSSSFFICSSSFVDLQPVSFQAWRFEFILCTLRGPFLLCMFSSSSRLLSVFFFFVFSEFRSII